APGTPHAGPPSPPSPASQSDRGDSEVRPRLTPPPGFLSDPGLVLRLRKSLRNSPLTSQPCTKLELFRAFSHKKGGTDAPALRSHYGQGGLILRRQAPGLAVSKKVWPAIRSAMRLGAFRLNTRHLLVGSVRADVEFPPQNLPTGDIVGNVGFPVITL